MAKDDAKERKPGLRPALFMVCLVGVVALVGVFALVGGWAGLAGIAVVFVAVIGWCLYISGSGS